MASLRAGAWEGLPTEGARRACSQSVRAREARGCGAWAGQWEGGCRGLQVPANGHPRALGRAGSRGQHGTHLYLEEPWGAVRATGWRGGTGLQAAKGAVGTGRPHGRRWGRSGAQGISEGDSAAWGVGLQAGEAGPAGLAGAGMQLPAEAEC